MKLVQSIAPTISSVILEEMKNYLRVLHSDDDAMIESMIVQAEQSAELIMNRQIMPCTYELYFDAMPGEITLPRPPFMELVSFEILYETVWSSVLEYEIDDKSTPAVLYPTAWGTISPAKNGVRVIYKAGWADASKVPESIKSWIRIQVATYYENRESFVIGTIVSPLPASHIDNLINRYRICNT